MTVARGDLPLWYSRSFGTADRRYRYLLARGWGRGDRALLWVMLNPSSADDVVDDPTIRRCVSFAMAARYDRMLVVNLFAFRASHPLDLHLAADPVGSENDRAISSALSNSDDVAVAWGANPFAAERAKEVMRMIRRMAGAPSPICLGKTASGAPRHPLYVERRQGFVPLSPAGWWNDAPCG